MRQFLYIIKRFLTDLFKYPAMVNAELSYDNYWQKKKVGSLGLPNSFQVARGVWIADKILENASVIDVGCGDGSILQVIKKTKRIQATGADVSDFILKFLEKNDIKSFNLDISDKDAIDKIPTHDHMLLLETLEHMSKPEDFLLKALTKVNKSVFISIPNTGYITHRLRLLFGKFPVQWRSHPSEHLRFWTVDDFSWWIDSLKLGNETTIHLYEGVPFLNRIWPSLFAQGIIAEVKIRTSHTS